MAAWLGDLATIASRQDGVFSAGQAEAVGVDRRRLNRAEADGILHRLHPNVWCVAGTPVAPKARIRAAVLQVGELAVASHESTLILNDLDSIPFAAAVTVPAGPASNRFDGIRVHRLCDLTDEQRRTIAGVPTTSIERAVVDLTSVFSRPRLEYVIDHLTITRRMTDVGAIGRALRQANRRGRLGIARLGPMLDARRPGEPAPRSKLERTVDELLAGSSLPRPLREHPLPSGHGHPGLVDRAWPEVKLILEIDGRTWHARERAMRRDRARDREAANVGWQTLRVLDEEVESCADVVLHDLLTTYAIRTEQVRSTA